MPPSSRRWIEQKGNNANRQSGSSGRRELASLFRKIRSNAGSKRHSTYRQKDVSTSMTPNLLLCTDTARFGASLDSGSRRYAYRSSALPVICMAGWLPVERLAVRPGRGQHEVPRSRKRRVSDHQGTERVRGRTAAHKGPAGEPDGPPDPRSRRERSLSRRCRQKRLSSSRTAADPTTTSVNLGCRVGCAISYHLVRASFTLRAATGGSGAILTWRVSSIACQVGGDYSSRVEHQLRLGSTACEPSCSTVRFGNFMAGT